LPGISETEHQPLDWRRTVTGFYASATVAGAAIVLLDFCREYGKTIKPTIG